MEDQIKAKEVLHLKTNEDKEALYKKEVALLKEQATSITQQYQQQIKELNQINEEKIRIAKQQEGSRAIFWILIALAAIAGIIIGKGCN